MRSLPFGLRQATLGPRHQHNGVCVGPGHAQAGRRIRVQQQAGAVGRQFGDGCRETQRRIDLGHKGPAALLGSAGGDPEPVFTPSRCPLSGDSHDAAFAAQREDGRNAQFGGFLNHEIHFLSAANALHKNDPQRGLSVSRSGFAHTDVQAPCCGTVNTRGVVMAIVMKKDHDIARLQTQYAAEMVRRATGNENRLSGTQRLRMINAGNWHVGIIHQPEQSWAACPSDAQGPVLVSIATMTGIDPKSGIVKAARHLQSPNCDERPAGCQPELIVVHSISLPPGDFGGPWIDRFFTNCLDHNAHPYFQEISSLKVSAHLLIRRDGEVVQYVPLCMRAWHAGESCFDGRDCCNDFSIGIELEGMDELPYEDIQYIRLAELISQLRQTYASLRDAPVVGHSDIAPPRKTHPGPAFDWARLDSLLNAAA